MIPEVPQMPALLAALPSPPFQQLTLGPLNFRMYGLVIALGVLAAVAIARRRFSARGGDPEDITTVAIFAVPAGLVGARIYPVITDFGDRYSDGRWWPDAFFIHTTNSRPGRYVPAGACKSFCVRGVGNGDCGQLPMSVGIRPSNTMAKWFKAAFQPTIGIVHFFDAS